MSSSHVYRVLSLNHADSVVVFQVTTPVGNY